MSIFRLTIVVTIFVLSACSAIGPRYDELQRQPLNGMSEIVVFRLSQFSASGGCYRVNIDGGQVGILANGGYIREIVEPRKYMVSIVIGGGLDLEIEAKPNETNYIQYSIGLKGMSAFPVGTVSVVDLVWNVALVDTPKDYGLKTVSNLRQSLKTHTCMSK